MLVNEILETFDLKPSGLLDKGGNKSFNVIDNNTGKTVKTFTGPNAAGLQLGKAIVAVFLTSLETIIVAVKGGQAVNKSIAVMKTALLAVPGFGWAAWIFSGIIQLIGAGAMWWAIKVLIDLQTKLQDPKVTRGAAEYFATRFFAPNLIASIAGVPGVTSGRLESIEENRYMVVEEMEVPTDLIKKAKAIFKKKVPKDKWKEIKAR